jgi:DNA-binding XRE family transcriptional regulator
MAKTLRSFKAHLLADKRVRKAYEGLTPEYAIARAIIAARAACRITQEELAARMNTSQPFVARLESGTGLPSMRTLLKIARATRTRPIFTFDPV